MSLKAINVIYETHGQKIPIGNPFSLIVFNIGPSRRSLWSLVIKNRFRLSDLRNVISILNGPVFHLGSKVFVLLGYSCGNYWIGVSLGYWAHYTSACNISPKSNAYSLGVTIFLLHMALFRPPYFIFIRPNSPRVATLKNNGRPETIWILYGGEIQIGCENAQAADWVKNDMSRRVGLSG